jgi:hexokinase
MSRKTESFLMMSGIDSQLYSKRAITNLFLNQMRAGLAGESSSLMMIPTYFSSADAIVRGEKVIALDAGGTNFRIALTQLNDTDVSILGSKTIPMPGSKGAITKDEFLTQVCTEIAPYLDEADRIGFCFSFPAEITPERDGRLVGFNKEVQVEGSAGMLVCAELKAKLNQMGLRVPKNFVLLNDTISAMLGGMASGAAGETLGFILGTGTNSCYSEKGANIAKLGSPAGNMIINMESGGLAMPLRGPFDRQLDESTANPGDHVFEKMVSGGYLGELLRLILRGAAQEGIFSEEAGEMLNALQTLELKDGGEFAQFGGREGLLSGIFTTPEDRAAACEIYDALIDRAACLTVCNIAAIMEQTYAGRDAPMTIAAEGSTFLKAYSFREHFDKHAQEFIVGELGRRYTIFTSDNMTLAGCTVAACMEK